MKQQILIQKLQKSAILSQSLKVAPATRVKTLMGMHPVEGTEHLGVHVSGKQGDDGQHLPVSSFWNWNGSFMQKSI